MIKNYSLKLLIKLKFSKLPTYNSDNYTNKKNKGFEEVSC